MKLLYYLTLIGAVLLFLHRKGEKGNINELGEEIEPMSHIDKIKFGFSLLLNLKNNYHQEQVNPNDDPDNYVGSLPKNSEMISYGDNRSAFSYELKKQRGVFKHEKRPTIQELYYGEN